MNRRYPKAKSYINRDGKKIYWEEYGENYIKIVKTGQIVRKENAKKFIDRTINDAFIENL
jgi:hypothetical protein